MSSRVAASDLTPDDLEAVRSGFGARRVLVVGDLMLDRYSWGDVRRISPEAPVQVLRLASQTESPGGAGNVAVGLRRLGLRVGVAGLVGDDLDGRRIEALLREDGCDTDGVVVDRAWRTTVKHRVVGGRQQLLRIDDESPPPASAEPSTRLIEAFERQLTAPADAILLSDYDKGALTGRVCTHVIERARELDVPVLVDPKGASYEKYARATGITPNEAELFVATAGQADTGSGAAAVEAAARLLLEDLGLEFVLVTQGERGMTLVEAARVLRMPATARDVFDVSGAGDTAIAALTASLAAGRSRRAGVIVANAAAGIAVGKVGTAVVALEELVDALEAGSAAPAASTRKVLRPDELAATLARWRAAGERVVFTNGCFDLLHAGHVSCLEQARAEGDRLVVGLNNDASVTRLKGPGRPVVPVDDRARVLAAFEAVDAVVVFEEDDPRRLITEVRPDVLVKGADYREEDIAGAAEVRSWGGRIVLIELLAGRSTTELLARGQDGATRS